MKPWISLSMASLIAVSMAGCGGDAGPPRPATVPVKLKVTISGKPVDEKVEVRLLPEPPKDGVSGVKGIRTADGTYALETFKPGDGAPPGTYLVQLGTNDVTTIGVQVPETKPASVIIPNDGGAVSVDLESTGKMRPGLLPPPKGQGMGAKRHG